MRALVFNKQLLRYLSHTEEKKRNKGGGVGVKFWSGTEVELMLLVVALHLNALFFIKLSTLRHTNALNAVRMIER